MCGPIAIAMKPGHDGKCPVAMNLAPEDLHEAYQFFHSALATCRSVANQMREGSPTRQDEEDCWALRAPLHLDDRPTEIIERGLHAPS